MLVLPVPGPPVITVVPWESAAATAASWCSSGVSSAAAATAAQRTAAASVELRSRSARDNRRSCFQYRSR